jgi:hypothetical protein
MERTVPHTSEVHVEIESDAGYRYHDEETD